jgi:hypothetical protein
MNVGNVGMAGIVERRRNRERAKTPLRAIAQWLMAVTQNSRMKIWGNCIARSLLAKPDGSDQTSNQSTWAHDAPQEQCPTVTGIGMPAR